MIPLLACLLCCLAAGLAGVIGTSLFWRSKLRREAGAQSEEARKAAQVLLRLQELAARVALDVGEHSTQVADINSRLSSTNEHDPATIVDVVANLIRANEQMHRKLASTEDKLRRQAQEIQTHVAEARTDSLTLLANRRAFDDELLRRTAEFTRQGRTFSLIMADVDHFKKLNDNYGHPMGDEVLRGVAKLLRRKMREMDVVCRYGGEEFAVILPGTSLDEASKAALRACEAIERHRFCHNGKEAQATVSFGVAEISAGMNGAALVARADRALYAAKDGGRNRAYVDDGVDVRRITAPPPAPAGHTPLPSLPLEAPSDQPAAQVELVEAHPLVPLAAEPIVLPELPSRTAFCQQVRSRSAESKRGGATFSIILLEVNQFDESGTERGSDERGAVMRSMVRYLAASCREMDIVGHYAPGCFALMLPTAGLPDAINVAERLREGLPRSNRQANEHLQLSLSVGVAQVMEGEDPISLLKRAEAALDAADRRGGNRAYYHDGARCAPITAMLETMDYLT